MTTAPADAASIGSLRYRSRLRSCRTTVHRLSSTDGCGRAGALWAQCAFHDPASWEHPTKAGLFAWNLGPFKAQVRTIIEIADGHPCVADDRDSPAQIRCDPMLAHTCVPLVHPHVLHRGKDGRCSFKQQGYSSLILMEPLPRAIQPPLSPIMKNGLPWREVMWQELPGAPTADDIQDRIQDLTSGVGPWSTARLLCE